jgi:uncharacterized membrane protein YphA (DoxX/SURF4 family)
MAALTDGSNNLGAIAASTWIEELIHERRQTAAPAVSQSASRRLFWAARLLLGMPVLFLLFDGVIKLTDARVVVEAQGQLGIPQNLTLTIAVLELACVFLYIVPQTAVLGAVLLTGYLGGAIAIQLRAGNPLASHVLFPLYVGSMLWAGVYLRDRRLRQFLLSFGVSRWFPVARIRGRFTGAISRPHNVALWVLQVLLAVLFLFAGATKLLLPLDVLASMGSPNQIVLPGWFIRFIGAAEVLGALGLILPRLLRIRVSLTPLAAAGLVVIMAGATVITAAAGDIAPAIFPLLIGIMSGSIVHGRWNREPR